jgi:4-amino-4-deoxy-L-arabinose transferase-like glycosyltransferase
MKLVPKKSKNSNINSTTQISQGNKPSLLIKLAIKIILRTRPKLKNLNKILSPYYLPLFICLLFFLSRFYSLDTDFHFLEPDEADYQLVAEGFLKPGWPQLRGKPYVENFPLFPFLTAQLIKVFNPAGKFVAIRTLSIIGNFLVGVGLYFYWRSKNNPKAGLISAVVFWLLPLSVFYSRTGTQEMFFMGLSFLGLILFMRLNSEKKIFPILSAVLVALSVLTKTNAVVFLLTPLILLILSPNKYIRRTITFYKISISISVILFSTFFLFFGKEFINQSKYLPSSHLLPLTNLKVHLATLSIYINNLSYYLSSLVLILLLIGLFKLIFEYFSLRSHFILLLKTYLHSIKLLIKSHKNLENIKQTILNISLPNQGSQITIEITALLIPPLIFLLLFNFSPRYFVLILPSLTLLSVHGFRLLPFKKYNSLLLLFIIPFSYHAWFATNHISIRELKKEVENLLQTNINYPVYSTVDPEKLSFYFQMPVSLLSQKAYEKGIIITDKQKTELFANFTQPQYQEMASVVSCLPDAKIQYINSDIYSHFPLNSNGNTFKIYLISPFDNAYYRFNDVCDFSNIPPKPQVVNP